MTDVVVTNIANAAVPDGSTPHPGAKYVKMYRNLGVRNFRLIVLQFCTNSEIYSLIVCKKLYL